MASVNITLPISMGDTHGGTETRPAEYKYSTEQRTSQEKSSNGLKGITFKTYEILGILGDIFQWKPWHILIN